jgi:hypothetical protein
LIDGPDGPWLGTEGVLDWPLCVVANAAVRGEHGDLVARLTAGETFSVGSLAIERPPPDLDLTEEIARFKEDSGYGDETIADYGGYVVMDGEPYPIVLIYDVAYALQEERNAWLRVRARESRAAEAWRRAREIGSYSDPLFRPEPEAEAPGEHAEAWLADLEAKARLVDTLEAELAAHPDRDKPGAVIELAATISAKRRFLLIDLWANGLLVPASFDAKARALDAWGFTTLSGYLTAARDFAAYMESPERKKMTGGYPIFPVLGAALSIDWFRKREPIPPKVVVGFLEWTGWCEREAFDHFARGDHTGGWWIWHSGSVTHTFYSRFDDGITPCVYRVT